MDFKKRFKRLINGGFTDEEYRGYREELNESNRDIVFYSSLFFIACLIITLILTLIFTSGNFLWIKYLAWIALLAACAVIVAVPTKRNHSNGILLVVYLYMTIVLLIAMNLGVWTTPNDVAVVFCAFTVIFPVLVYDKTWRIGLFLGAWTVAFCLLVWHIKEPAVALNDIAHQCIMLALALFLAYHTSKMKVGAIKYRASIEVQRDVDALCGIPNRRRFDVEMRNVTPGMRADDASGVLMADIDLFKTYNDTYGHQEGDVCLQQVAAAMDSVAKEHGLFLARYGGEEFVCIIRNRCNVEVASAAEQMREAVDALGIPNKNIPWGHVTISVGYTCSNQSDVDMEELVSQADHALYAAKDKGRNQVYGWE